MVSLERAREPWPRGWTAVTSICWRGAPASCYIVGDLLDAIAKKLRLSASVPKLAWKSDPVEYYDFLGDDVVEGESDKSKPTTNPLWLNLGFWESARTYPEAAEAMARLVAEAAQLGPNDALLDVGFGFGEQDFYWLERFGVKHITGLNISPMQVERTQKRAQERGVADRMSLGVGSADGDALCRRLVRQGDGAGVRASLSDARALFRGGISASCARADASRSLTASPSGHKPISLTTRLVLRHWASPVENYYDRQVYAEKLRASGFTNVTCRSIAQGVFPGIIKYSDYRRSGRSMAEAVVELSPEDIEQATKRIEPFGITDYIIVSAQKPATHSA